MMAVVATASNAQPMMSNIWKASMLLDSGKGVVTGGGSGERENEIDMG